MTRRGWFFVKGKKRKSIYNNNGEGNSSTSCSQEHSLSSSGSSKNNYIATPTSVCITVHDGYNEDNEGTETSLDYELFSEGDDVMNDEMKEAMHIIVTNLQQQQRVRKTDNNNNPIITTAATSTEETKPDDKNNKMIAKTSSLTRKRWERLRKAIVEEKRFRRNSKNGFKRPSFFKNQKSSSVLDAEKKLKEKTESGGLGCYCTIPCIIGMLSYIVLGVGIYHMGEGWSVRDCLYFVVVTFSTVGYGDLSPSSWYMKIFTMVYALVGVWALGLGLGVIGRYMVNLKLDRLKQIEDQRAHQLFQKFETTNESSNNDPKNKGNDGRPSGSHEQKQEDKDQQNKPFYKDSSILTPLSHMGLVFLVGTIVFSFTEGWSTLDSLYYTFTTTTTIGYGDYNPSDQSRWFSIFFLPVAVAVISEVLSTIASHVCEVDIRQAEQNLIESDLTIDDLIAMDTDGDGHVDQLEYFMFMLKAMGKIDQPLIDQLCEQFERLDADKSGTLEVSDLEVLARRERAVAKMKKICELSQYKKDMMKVAASAAVTATQQQQQQQKQQDEQQKKQKECDHPCCGILV